MSLLDYDGLDYHTGKFKTWVKKLLEGKSNAGHKHTKSDITDFPTSMPANGGNSTTVNGHTVNSDVPANAKFTDTTYNIATTTANGLMSKEDKTKLDGIATGAEVNQNAFSNVVVGSTTISADSKTDSLTLAGSNVTITPDATNDKVTIGITKDNVISALGYTPGSSVDNNTTYTLSKSGSTITLTGSDGSKTSVTDSDTNIDTKVTQTVTTSNASYPLLLAPSGQTATTTTTSYFDSGVTLNPSTNTITANISGNSATATKLATARTIALTGSVTGYGTFDGSGNLSIATTTNHTHSYLPLSGGTVTGNILCSDKCSLGSDSSPFSYTSTKYLHANSIMVGDTLGSLTRLACKISSEGYLALGSPIVENLGGKIKFCNDSCEWQYLEPCTSLGSEGVVKNYLPSKNGTLTVSSDITPTYTSALSDGSTKMFSQAGAYAMYSELNSNLATTKYNLIQDGITLLPYTIWGNKVYRKHLSIGSLPNNKTQSYNTGVPDTAKAVVGVSGWIYHHSNGTRAPLPYTAPVANQCIGVTTLDNGKTLFVMTGMDRSDFSADIFIDYV